MVKSDIMCSFLKFQKAGLQNLSKNQKDKNFLHQMVKETVECASYSQSSKKLGFNPKTWKKHCHPKATFMIWKLKLKLFFTPFDSLFWFVKYIVKKIILGYGHIYTISTQSSWMADFKSSVSFFFWKIYIVCIRFREIVSTKFPNFPQSTRRNYSSVCFT